MPELDTLENASSAAIEITITPASPPNCLTAVAIGVRLPASSSGGITPVMTNMHSP